MSNMILLNILKPYADAPNVPQTSSISYQQSQVTTIEDNTSLKPGFINIGYQNNHNTHREKKRKIPGMHASGFDTQKKHKGNLHAL